ncbi:Metabotropic glutamate receptor 3 [Geodia barretti]|uniref:Metabotropic glutamate receptor 3 n=1 Tax=Geodia barretti TaxID=519541 RepID=A0AA35XBI7_GEOBA|nr:Metabotropic glutamate receptor 3 [Geodia barretti]
MCSALLPLLSTAEVEFMFETTRSDVVRDERDGGRIRGIRNRENKTFVLGALFPLHLHSPNSEGPPCGEPRKARGAERVEAVLYAIDIINADSNLLPGVELGYDIRDTCLSETVGLDEAIDLIITGSDLVIESCDVTGGAANSTAYAVAPTSGIIGAAGSRVSVPIASLGRLFETPQISYASTSPLLSDRTRYSYFSSHRPTGRPTKDTYGSSGINEFVNVSAENRICIDLRRGIPPSFSGNDFDNLVADLGNSRANVMVFFATQDSVREVLTRVNANDTLRRKFTWIASDGWAHSIDVIHLFNDTAVGVFGVTPLTEYLGSVLGSYEVLNYQASFSSTGDITGYQLRTVGSWVNGELTIIVDDTELQFGLNSDDSLRREPIESQCGGCSPGMYIREIPGACCAICEPCLGANYSSEPSSKQCNTCLSTGDMWGNNPFSGSNSCVTIPETSAMYSDPWAIPSLIIACIGVLCVAATAVIFGVYWKTPVIKSSSREQMILLLIGVSCSFILPFFYVAPPSIPICLVNRLGIWFCYSLMFAALAVKAQRVARIFYGVKRNIHYKPRFATPIYQVIFTLIIVAIQMIPIIISVAIVHPDVLRTLRYDRDSEVATILGVFSFKFPKNFNEAKYISFCTFSLLVVWVGLIPTYFTTESQPEIQNAAISLFITMSAFGVLCFIFGPKLFIVVFRPDKNYATTQHTKKDTENGTQEKQSHLSTSKFESD